MFSASSHSATASKNEFRPRCRAIMARSAYRAPRRLTHDFITVFLFIKNYLLFTSIYYWSRRWALKVFCDRLARTFSIGAAVAAVIITAMSRPTAVTGFARCLPLAVSSGQRWTRARRRRDCRRKMPSSSPDTIMPATAFYTSPRHRRADFVS